MPSPIPWRVRREGGQSSRTPMWLPSHPALDAGSRNTGRSTCKIHSPYGPLSGPRIAVRGDSVLDAVSRIYPLFISKGNSRQYRLGHWGARPPLFFSRKRKGKAKRKLPADVRKLKNVCESRGKRTRRARSASVQKAIPLRAPRPIHPGSNIFSPHSALSGIFLSAFSHRPVYLRLSSSAMNWTPHRCAG